MFSGKVVLVDGTGFSQGWTDVSDRLRPVLLQMFEIFIMTEIARDHHVSCRKLLLIAFSN